MLSEIDKETCAKDLQTLKDLITIMITETKADPESVVNLTWTLLNFASELITRTIMSTVTVVNADKDAQSNLLFSILEDMKGTVEQKVEFMCGKLDLTNPFTHPLSPKPKRLN